MARDKQFERLVRPKPRPHPMPAAREAAAQREPSPITAARALMQIPTTALRQVMPLVRRVLSNRTLQRLASESEFTAPPDVEQRLASERGHGDHLEDGLRSQMEGALGAPLDDVRIHRDSQAAALSDALGARAFTHGADVYFAEGEYAPATEGGQRVLAHELAHVVQQHSGPKLVVGGAHDPAEIEADQVAEQVVRGLRSRGTFALEKVRRTETPEEEEAEPLRRQEEEKEEEEAVQTLRRQEEEEEEAQLLRRQEKGDTASQDVTAGKTGATPDDRARALYTEASQAYQEGAYSAALERFQQILDIPGLRSSVYSAILWNMARCHQRLGDREAAAGFARKYLAQPDISEQDRAEGERLLTELTGNAEGGANVTGTVETEEGGPSVEPEQPSSPTEEAPLPTEPDERGRALYERGAAAYRAGNYAEAISRFNQVLEVGGLHPRAYATMLYNLARAYRRMGNIQMALTMVRGFLGQDSISAEDRVDGATLLRELLAETGETAEAGGKLPEGPTGAAAQAAQPPTGEATLPPDPVARGQALYAQAEQAYVAGRPAEALALYNQVLGISGLQPNVYATTLWNIARCHQRLGNNGAAIAMLRAYLAQPSLSDRDRADAHELMAQLQRP